MSWWIYRFVDGSVCADYDWHGFVAHTCSPAWLFWGAIVAASAYLLWNGIRIIRALKRE